MANSLIRRCKEEYGESFKDFAMGCAEMGYSLTMTAQALGTHRQDLVRNLKRFALYDIFVRPQKEMCQQCKPGGKGIPQGYKHRYLATGKGKFRLTWYEGEPTYHYLKEMNRKKHIKN